MRGAPRRASLRPADARPEVPDHEILRKIGKNSPENELNCMACGYPSCRDKAIAVYQGKAELTMCMPYMQEQACSMARIIMDKLPDDVLAADSNTSLRNYCKIILSNQDELEQS